MKNLRALLTLLVLFSGLSAVAQEGLIYEWHREVRVEPSFSFWPLAKHAVDQNGNVYLAAAFRVDFDADPGPGVANISPVNNNYDDLYIIKYNSNGDFQWVRTYSRLAAKNIPGEISIDASGNVFLLSFYEVGFATHQTRINKIDANGNELWEKQIITNGWGGRALELDLSGNPVITGGYRGTVDFDPNAGSFPLTSTATSSGNDLFLMKLDTDGNFLWAKTTSNVGTKTATAITKDITGNLYIAGYFHSGQSDFDLGAGISNLTPTGTSADGFVLKLEDDGDLIWVRSTSGTALVQIYEIAVSPTGNIFASGAFRGTVDFDPSGTQDLVTASSMGSTDAFLWRLNPDGGYGWTYPLLSTANYDEGRDVTFDNSGNIIFTGLFQGTIDFDPGPGVTNLTSSGTFTHGNPFLVKMTQDRDLIWAKTFGSSNVGYAIPTSVRVDNAGKVILGGVHNSFHANPGPCTNNLGSSTQDIFIVKYELGFEAQPVITSFTPTNGTAGTTVVITGANFGTDPADIEVRFSPNRLATITSLTPTSITTTLPASSSTGPIYIRLKCFPTTISSQQFIVGTPPTPTITSFTPTSGTPGTTVTITGTNFSTTPANNAVRFNGTLAVVTASTATSITTTVPAGATTGNISVTVGAITANSASPFTVTCGPAATITSFTPLSGTIGAPVTITGTNFSTTPANNVVRINGTLATVTASTATSITTTVPAGASGTGPITVNSNVCNTATSSASFTVVCPNPPTITSFSPGSGFIGSTVTITGTNFTTTPGDHTVRINGALADVDASTSTTLTVTVPAGAIGTGPITVTLAGCAVATSATNFTTTCPPAPTISSFTPTTGVTGTTVTITGTNFSSTATNNLVDFNGVTAVVTSSTSTSIVTTVPAGATPGPISVSTGCAAVPSATDFDYYAIVSIDTDPTDNTACGGDIASISVSATGTTNLAYQWQYSSDGIAPFTDINNSAIYTNTTTNELNINTIGSAGTGFYRCKVNGDYATEVISGDGELTVNTRPATPGATGATRCDSGTVTLTANGGTDGNYRWYTVASGGTAIAAQVNSSLVTPALSTTTNYFVAVADANCESVRAMAIATINNSPPAPPTTGASGCPQSVLTLTASGGAAGEYRWYENASGGTPIAAETNNTYITPALAATTTYYVSRTSNGCEGQRAAVVATIVTAGCAPEIAETDLTTEPGGTIILDLKPLITTIGTLDLSSIVVTGLPTSGATVTIADGVLTLTYTGTSFSGNETITIQACNTNGTCSEQDFTILVVGEIAVYNAVSPNGDNKNDILYLEFIDLITDTKSNTVSIYNRWGDEVYSVNDYDNKTRVFEGISTDGNRLPSGVYYYKVVLPDQNKTLTGYLELKF